jgi:hypothetical protein
MGSASVEIRDICREHGEQMVVIPDEQMVQALTAERTDEPLTDCIGTRRTERGFNDLNPAASSHRGKMLPILLVVVSDEVLGATTKRRGFTLLLGNPGIGRVARYAQMNHPPRAKVNDHKDKQ